MRRCLDCGLPHDGVCERCRQRAAESLLRLGYVAERRPAPCFPPMGEYL